jgi:hypothetical protein
VWAAPPPPEGRGNCAMKFGKTVCLANPTSLTLGTIQLCRGRIAPRGAARAPGPRSVARRRCQPRAAASAESAGPSSPIIGRERGGVS